MRKPSKILSLIAGIFMLPAIALAEDIPKKQAPKEQEKMTDFYRKPEYRSGFLCRDFYMLKDYVHEHRYDIDGDGIPDVSEMYLHLSDGTLSKHPKYYWFDIIRNKRVDIEEMIIDEKMDGLENKNQEQLIEWLIETINKIQI